MKSTQFVIIFKPVFFLAALVLLGAGSARADQMNYGKYFGIIQMDGQPEAIAVLLDAFITQINDPTVYPALDVVVRVNLGGYSSSEYVGYHYYDPTFNFEKGILQLNDPKDDLTATLQVTNTNSESILEGSITHRLTNSKGRMRVTMKLFGGHPVMPTEPLQTLLKGDYFGSCGTDQAELQIETGRGVGASAPGNALSGVSITGRLGYTNGPLCYPDATNKFCALYPYSVGTFSPFTNRLKMQAKLGTLECSKSYDQLNCNVIGYDKSGSCVLTKKSSLPTGPAQIPANLLLNVSTDLKLPLPAPAPPGNDDLISSLNGNFYGFLHFENRDEYQLMEMGVVATTSTENPHIQNQVMVEPTILLRLGSSWSSTPALSIAYPQRVFWLNTGFAFQSVGGDYFAVIGTWQKAYLNGVLYSRSFGRVGTFEMQKGTPPEIPVNMALLPDPSGNYRGPNDGPYFLKNLRSILVDIPNDTQGADQMGVPLVARYSGPGQMTTFDSSSLDLNTGSLSFLFKKPGGDSLVTGAIGPNGNLKLLWPVGPVLGAPMSGYGAFTYSPKH